MWCAKGQRQSASFSSMPMFKKGLWSPEEDVKLKNYMMKNNIADCSWSYVAKQAGLQRCGKSCRLRWINYLRPGLKHTAVSPLEEQLIIRLQSTLGNRWSQIAAHLPGRTDNEIKNYWNSYIKKKLNLKHSMIPLSSSTESNGRICTEYNMPSESGDTCNINSASANSHDAYTLFHSAKPLDVMSELYLQSFYNIFDVLATKENQHSRVQDVLDLKNEQVFTSPSLQVYDQTCNTEKVSSGDQLIASWTTLPRHEVSGSTINAYGCTTTNPALIDMGDSSKASSGINPCQFHSNPNEFTDVYQGAYTAHMVEDYARQLHEKTNSRAQFRTPAIMSEDVGHYLNIQPHRLFDWKDDVYLGYDEEYLRAKTYINIQKQKSYEGIQVGDQLGFFLIPNEASAGECGTFGSRCEGEAGHVNVLAQEDHTYNIGSDLDQFCFT